MTSKGFTDRSSVRCLGGKMFKFKFDDRRLALHESAHCLIAVAHRLPIEYVTIRPSDIGDDAVAGVTQYGRCDSDYRLADSFAAGIAVDGFERWTQNDLLGVRQASTLPVETHVDRASRIISTYPRHWHALTDALLREGRLTGGEVANILRSVA